MDTQFGNEKTVRGFLLRHITAIDILCGVLIVVLAVTSVYTFTLYRNKQAELVTVIQRSDISKVNRQVLEFTSLFITEVLQANGEIDFDTRLKLESTVRALNDKEILAAWLDFTGSKSEPAAQSAVKTLLGLLVAKIR